MFIGGSLTALLTLFIVFLFALEPDGFGRRILNKILDTLWYIVTRITKEK